MKNSFCLFFGWICSIVSLSAQSSEELRSWLPEISGWSISGKTEMFDADNLFDRINGAAPLFIENNFQEMTSLEYTKGDDYITLQLYRHASPEDAFGMYASERSSGLSFYPIGGEAQGDESSLYFFAGNIYAKIWGSADENLSTILHTIGKELAGKIDPNAAYPSLFSAFPNEGKIPHSEVYITSGYLGHKFLKGVYAANYEKDGRNFQLFIIHAKTGENAAAILKNYLTFAKQPSSDLQEGNFTIKDRYNGDIHIIWKSNYLIGIFSEDGKEIADSDLLLDSVCGKLP